MLMKKSKTKFIIDKLRDMEDRMNNWIPGIEKLSASTKKLSKRLKPEKNVLL